MSNDVVYEKVVSAQIKNLNSGSASEFPVCRLGETQRIK